MTNPRLQQLLELFKEDEKDEFLLFALAKEYEKAGQLEEALTYYLKLLEVNENYVGTYYHLAKLYEKREAPDKALSIYNKGIEITRKLGDQHALSELMNAKMNLEIEF